MVRALTLLLLTLKGQVRKFSADLMGEATVLVSGAILFATFFYMFNDFLNVQVKSVSDAMRDTFVAYISPAVLFLGWFGGVRAARHFLSDSRSYHRAASLLGEVQQTTRLYKIFVIALLWSLCHGAAFWINEAFLVPLSAPSVLTFEALFLLTSIAFLFWPPLPTAIEAPTKPRRTSAVREEASRLATLVRWRLVQMLFRNRLTQWTLIAAGGFEFLVIIASFSQSPAFVTAAAHMLVGLFVSCGIIFQLTEDLQSATTERLFGIAHHEFQQTYNLIGMIFAASLFVFTLVVGLALYVPTTWQSLLEVVQIAIVGGLFPLMLPWIALQIDARRPFMPLVSIVIVGLFVGTAVLVNILFLLIVPLLKHYAERSQDGRFYRA